MADNRMSSDELEAFFGPTIPTEAINLLFYGPPETTVAEMRSQLKQMGARHKRRRAALDAAIITLEYIASAGFVSVRDQAEMVALAALDAYEAWSE